MAQPKGISIEGLPELQAKLTDLITVVTGKPPSHAVITNPEVSRTIAHVVADAAKFFKTEIQSVGRSRGVSRRVVESAFTYSDVAKMGASAAAGVRRTSALTGINKQRTMLEWTASKNPKSPRAKVSYPGKVAMSLAAMFEIGTTRMKARHYFTDAVSGAMGRAGELIKAELTEIIDRLTAARKASGKTI